MKTIPCPCGRAVRPCNLARHMRARHTPDIEETDFGAVVIPPANPIKQGRGKDRRHDDLLPRGEGPHRFRIYRLRAGDLEVMATAATEEKLGIGLVRLHSQRKFVGDDSVGVLDTKDDPGHWIVNPFTLGRSEPK